MQGAALAKRCGRCGACSETNGIASTRIWDSTLIFGAQHMSRSVEKSVIRITLSVENDPLPRLSTLGILLGAASVGRGVRIACAKNAAGMLRDRVEHSRCAHPVEHRPAMPRSESWMSDEDGRHCRVSIPRAARSANGAWRWRYRMPDALRRGTGMRRVWKRRRRAEGASGVENACMRGGRPARGHMRRGAGRPCRATLSGCLPPSPPPRRPRRP